MPSATHPVQACITAVGFPATLELVEEMVEDNRYVRGALTDIDTLLRFKPAHQTTWTAPRWMTAGDILFFYHTRRGQLNVARLLRQVERGVHVAPGVAAALERAADQAERFAGSIFACAEVSGRPSIEADPEGYQHFRSTIYAPLGTMHLFDVPVPSEDFSAAVTLSTGGTLTPVHGQALNALKATLAEANELPAFLRDAVPGTVGFRNVTRHNWHRISTSASSVFLDESQLRAYLLDFLLEDVKDPRTVVYEECECLRDGRPTGIADYFVRVSGNWVPVEAKLNVRAERDLPGQVRKYLRADAFRPRRGAARGRVVQTARPGLWCLVADQAGVYALRDGAFVDCSLDEPLWPRGQMTSTTGAEIRAWLRERLG